MNNVSIIGRIKSGDVMFTTTTEGSSLQGIINTIYVAGEVEYKVLTSNDKFPELFFVFKNAFKLKEGFSRKTSLDNCFLIDYEKAKEIWRDKYREARSKILPDLDVEYIKALESGDTQKQLEISEKKMNLRNVTKIDLPNDLKGILNTWPEFLGEKPSY